MLLLLLLAVAAVTGWRLAAWRYQRWLASHHRRRNAEIAAATAAKRAMHQARIAARAVPRPTEAPAAPGEFPEVDALLERMKL